jgi:hypothetical protein
MALYTVSNGPSELDLFVLGLARRQPVGFTMGDESTSENIFVIINGIKKLDENNKNWHIEGYVHNDPLKFIKKGSKIKGNFSYSKGRKGMFDIKKIY